MFLWNLLLLLLTSLIQIVVVSFDRDAIVHNFIISFVVVQIQCSPACDSDYGGTLGMFPRVLR